MRKLQLQKTLPALPKAPYAFASVVNTFDACDLKVTLLDDGNNPVGEPVSVASNTSLINDKHAGRDELFKVPAGMATWTIIYEGAECSTASVKALGLPSRVSYQVQSGQVYFIYVGAMGSFIAQAETQKPTGATGEFSMA